MQNPFAHAHFRDRSRPFIVVVLLLVGLVIGGSIFAKPVWRKVKDRRALKFVAAARAAIAANDVVAATGQLRAAHASSPHHPEVLRATGEHFSRLSRPEGLIYWRQLSDSGYMTDTDRFAFVRLAVACEDYELARKAVIPFGTSRPKDPDALRLLAEVYLGFRELELAANTLREAMDVAPYRSDLQVVLSRIELANDHPQFHGPAKGRLWQVVALGGTNQPAAAFALLQSRDLNPADLRLLDSLIRPGATASFEERLVQLLVRLRLSGASKDRIVDQFRRDIGLREESADFQKLLTALSVAKEFSTVTNLLPITVVERYHDLYPHRLEALVGLRDGNELESTLAMLGGRVGRAQASIYAALAASFSGRTNELKQIWQNAVSHNAASPAVLKIVAERAEQEGMIEAATQAWDGLLGAPGYARQAAHQLIRLSLNSTDARPALRAYSHLLRIDPAGGEYELQLAFLRLLYGTQVELAGESLAKQRDSSHHRDLFAMAAGLAALQENRPDSAVTIMDKAGIDWATAPRRWRVVRAAALEKCGQRVEAQMLLKGTAVHQLSPPELALAGELITKKADQ